VDELVRVMASLRYGRRIKEGLNPADTFQEEVVCIIIQLITCC